MANRPELMAIGDSIYNGTRSLTTNGELARISAPAQVANAFNWPFAVPTYPTDVLLNIETIIRNNEFNLDQIVAGVIANAEGWMGPTPWSTLDQFDNISIAQSTIADQWTLKFSDQYPAIGTLTNKLINRNALGLDDGTVIDTIMALYTAVNVSFLLNPGRDPNGPWATMTPLDIVKARKPKRLLVNLGINDGVWTICLQAVKDQFNALQIRDDMNKLGGYLLAMKKAGDIDQIYLNLLPKPSCIANLMPRTDPPKPPGASGYYDEYLGRLGQIGGLTGQDMADLDAQILALNNQMQSNLSALFAGTGGINFVDLYAMVAERDDKHFRDQKPIWAGGERINNYPLEVPHKGGFFGLDNLHPTTVGYAVLAQTVCEQISSVEQIPASKFDFNDAFSKDSLLQHVPLLLSIDNLLASLLVSFFAIFNRPGTSV